MDSMYLDNLDEYINDGNIIVTYRWLSLTLDVPSNVAKQMLFHYYDKSRNSDKECKLSATYLISGIHYDDELKQDVHKICVVRDEELEEKKNTFKIIYSLHIYSLQKIKIKDLHILYGVDYDVIKEDVFKSAKYSSIFSASPFRSSIQSKHQIPILSPKNKSPKKNIVKAEVEENGFVNNKENKLSETVSLQKRNVKTTKGALQSMFANQAKKNEIKKPLEVKQEPNTKSCKSVSEESKKKSSMDAFISKGTKTRSPEGLRRSPRKSQDSKIEEDNKVNINSVDSVVKKEEKRETRSSPRKKGNKVTKGSTRSPVQKGKRKSTTTDSKSVKRQRIMTLADSSSESDNDEEEDGGVLDESPIPSPSKALQSDEDDDESPFPPTPKPTESVEQKSQRGKTRKKKEVVRTYEDDDGYLVTIKDNELVTDSDEDPIPPAKPIKSSPKATKEKESPKTNSPIKNSPQKKRRSPRKGSPQKKKKKSPSKAKQSSITSFFKFKS